VFVAFMARRWKRNVERRVKRLWLVMPRDGVERALWVGVSLAAGIGEEIVYRGVLFTVLTRATDSALAAGAVCTIAFALAHWTQGRSSVLVIAAFTIVFHLVVWTTGSLYVAMAVHVAYDLAAGFAYSYWGRRLGYPRTDAELAALPAGTPYSAD
jgi:membrane protease YdiL (CAAX protease family)